MILSAAQEEEGANQDNIPSKENNAAVQQIFSLQAEKGGRRLSAGRQ